MSINASGEAKPLGFWSCWSLTVGIMIGSGIFLLPSVLAPYGMVSFAGWAITATGSICLALVIGRLAGRTHRSGGVYVYAQDAFGELTGFLVAWGYWASYCIAMPAMAITFAGYLGVFVPAVEGSSVWQIAVALGLIWSLTWVNITGIKEAGSLQLVMTILKLIPLGLVIGLAAVAGDVSDLPQQTTSEGSLAATIAATALLTMWAFSGLEAGTVPAGEVANAERTVPRAIVFGTLTVAFVYIASTFAVMSLVPGDELARSTRPFADAAAGLGSWGPGLIAIGAMVSTAGALNGTIFVTGQMPLALAMDGLAPSIFKRQGNGKAPVLSLLLASSLASLLLLTNYTRGLIDLFTFFILISTLSILVPLLVAALAELKHSLKSEYGWAGLALAALAYTAFTILGSGTETLLWGLVLFAAGLPLFWWMRRVR